VQVQEGSLIELKNNTRAGCLLSFAAQGLPFQEATVSVMGRDVVLGQNGGLVNLPVSGRATVSLGYRFTRAQGRSREHMHGLFPSRSVRFNEREAFHEVETMHRTMRQIFILSVISWAAAALWLFIPTGTAFAGHIRVTPSDRIDFDNNVKFSTITMTNEGKGSVTIDI
jgi:hypothetical protein